MKKLRIIGLSLLVFVLTTTSVFAVNASQSVTASSGGKTKISSSIQGQNIKGKVTISSSGGGEGYYSETCNGFSNYYGIAEIPSSGGVISQEIDMHTGCHYVVIVKSGAYFSILGTIQNYL